MKKKEIIKLVAIGIAAGVVCVLLVMLFTPGFRNQPYDYKDVIREKDRQIEKIRDERKRDSVKVEDLRKQITELRRRDSLLSISINKQKQTIKGLEKELNDIPDRSGYPDDSIRAAFERY